MKSGEWFVYRKGEGGGEDVTLCVSKLGGAVERGAFRYDDADAEPVLDLTRHQDAEHREGDEE